MQSSFQPMLAGEVNLDTLEFPVYASAKLDGVRALVLNGTLLSRTLKPIPNRYLQSLFSRFEWYDGELISGPPTAKDCYRRTVSSVMTQDSTDFDVRFHVFDHVEKPNWPFQDRIGGLFNHGGALRVHKQHLLNDLDDLLVLEQTVLSQGYEGLILRNPKGKYKYGRSTTREGGMLKVKRFRDAEFEVVGFYEREHNANAAFLDERGYTKRSSHQENKVGRGDLGALVLKFGDTTFNVGTGFTDAERETIWRYRDSYLGRLAKVKYFAVGMKDLPRHPVFLGWRDELDL